MWNGAGDRKNLKAKGISWKKYNLACNIPEGRWNGRLDEECASKVKAGSKAASKKASAGQNVSENTEHGKESGIQSGASETKVSGGNNKNNRKRK